MLRLSIFTVSILCFFHVLRCGYGSPIEDVNGCGWGQLKCHPKFGSCANTNGIYKCYCRHGFVGNGEFCIDIDECRWGLARCHHNARCVNTLGSYKCECNRGYKGNGVFCEETDKCADKTHGCHANATCIISPGGYTCACNVGYRGNGRVCVDINECEEGVNNCNQNAICTNTEGRFSCACRDGFRGDGINCKKIPICPSKTLNKCSRYADCSEDLNKVGYECNCKFGFFGDGNQCTGSRGYEFMFLLMENIRPYSNKPALRAQLFLAADRGGEITISTSPRLDRSIKRTMDQTIRIRAGINSVNMSNLIRMSEDQKVEKKGVLVKSDQLITLFALNHEGFTSDSMLVLPLDRLGKKYYIASTQPHDEHEDYSSQVALVATEDQTRVTVTLKSGEPGKTIMYKGAKFRSGNKLEINMNKYETFQIAHQSDLTGTIVSSTKPVGVVSGNRCNKLRRGPRTLCSHLVEMLPPLDSWDRMYVVPPHYLHDGTIVRILASQRTTVNTSISSTTNTTTLSASKFVDIVPDFEKAVVIQADHPVQVMSFAKGGGRQIDPYFTMNQGINQFVHEYHFAVPNHFDNDYVAVTIETSKSSQLRLDRTALSSPVHKTSVDIGGKQYNIETYAVSAGSHKLSSQNGARFGLIIFGDRRYDGYGYPGNLLVEGTI